MVLPSLSLLHLCGAHTPVHVCVRAHVSRVFVSVHDSVPCECTWHHTFVGVQCVLACGCASQCLWACVGVV